MFLETKHCVRSQLIPHLGKHKMFLALSTSTRINDRSFGSMPEALPNLKPIAESWDPLPKYLDMTTPSRI
jgi:hypothetical protein